MLLYGSLVVDNACVSKVASHGGSRSSITKDKQASRPVVHAIVKGDCSEDGQDDILALQYCVKTLISGITKLGSLCEY